MQELWKARNRAHYPAQKRRLAARPEYLARRRERYARSKDRAKDLSTRKDSLHEYENIEETYEGPDYSGDRGWSPAEGAC